MGKALRVDHVSDYKPPKENDKMDEETRQLHTEGCAPKLQLNPVQIKQEHSKDGAVDGIRLPPRLPIEHSKSDAASPKKVR